MKKYLAMLLALALVLCAVPAVMAAPSAPTAGGNCFFANGTPVTITGEAPAEGQAVTFDGLTTTGTDAYISWDENGTTKYVAASSGIIVFGGGNGNTTPVTVDSTSITMTGGTVKRIYGGNYGKDNDANNQPSVVSGNVDIHISGDAVVTDIIAGGGLLNTAVNGTVNIIVENAPNMQGNQCYIMGGVQGNGTEGVRDIANGTMTTNAVVNKVNIQITNSKVCLVTGGGQGSTKTGSASITINGSTADYVYINGINGVTESASLSVNDSAIGELAATNRGFLGSATATIEGNSTITNFATGAASDCFQTDSGSVDGSGVTGSMTWNLGENVTVTKAEVTPLIKSNGGQYEADLGNTTITKAGDPLAVTIGDFAPKTGISVVDIEAGGSLNLSGVTATLDDSINLDNKGSITVGSNSKLDATAGKLTNAGSIAVTGNGSLAAGNNNIDNTAGSITVSPNATVDGTIAGNAPVVTQPTTPPSGEGEAVVVYKISLQVGQGGKASEEAGDLYIGKGQDFKITFTPDEGNVVSRLVVDGKQVTAANSYTFENLSADHTIRVEFGKTVQNPSSNTNPGTGDASGMGVGVAVLLAAASASVLLLKKRK